MTFHIPEINAVDAGLYPASLLKVELKTSDKDGSEYRQWTFACSINGKIEEIRATSSTATGPKSKAYGWLVALLGFRPEPGDDVDPIGKRCILHLIVDEESGYNRIEAVLPYGAVAVPQVVDDLPPLEEPPSIEELIDDVPF